MKELPHIKAAARGRERALNRPRRLSRRCPRERQELATRFDGLLNGDPEITVPDSFIGEICVRYALAIYETDKRKPTTMLRTDYGILPLNSDGTLDNSGIEEKLRLLLHARPPLGDGPRVVRREGSVVDGSRIFLDKRLRHEWEWEPSNELQEEIHEIVFA